MNSQLMTDNNTSQYDRRSAKDEREFSVLDKFERQKAIVNLSKENTFKLSVKKRIKAVNAKSILVF